MQRMGPWSRIARPMGDLRRGFKAYAERLALAVRKELGMEVTDPFDCLALAADLGVPIVSLSDMVKLGASRASVAHLSPCGHRVFRTNGLRGNGAADRVQPESPSRSQG